MGKSPTYIDLFSGCGGLSLGFEEAGFEPLLAIDVEENCMKTYKRNFPNTNFLCKNLSSVSNAEMERLLKGRKPDIIIGGPPCQGFSLANKKRNKVKHDSRNKLFYQFVRMVDYLKPKLFLMENVIGLLSTKDGKVIDTILEEFKNAGIGYSVEKEILNAADFGVPQLRERVFIMGVRRDLKKDPSFPIPEFKPNNYVTVFEAISDLPPIEAGEGDDIQRYNAMTNAGLSDYQRSMRIGSRCIYNHIAMRHTSRLVERFKVIKCGQSVKHVPKKHSAVKRGDPSQLSGKVFSQNNKRVYSNQPIPTIAASFQSNFIHPCLNRNFTAREGARLQSFPDRFVFEGMRTKMSWEKGLSQYQQIGNAVPPLLARAVANHVKVKILGGRKHALLTNTISSPSQNTSKGAMILQYGR